MQVVKDIALRMLNVYISPYVDNLNPNDLQLSVLSGKADLKHLKLKKSVLERFGLPVEIVAGEIGNLSITIPWQAIKNQPARIEIDDIYVLARARPQGKVDPEEDERVEQATKQNKLKQAEMIDSTANQVDEGAEQHENKESYLGAIFTRIINNVQIHVKNVHLRYEDDTNTPQHPFAAGVAISEFKMVSTDENWIEAFLQNNVQDVHKLAKLSSLSVYFDTDAGSIDKGVDNQGDTIAALKEMLLDESAKHQYILKPVTGEARLIIHRTMTKETPKYEGQVLFEEIGVVLDRSQYRDALSVLDVFHFYHRTHQYYKFRPPEKEFEQNPARARWKFALNAILSEVHDRQKRWTWDYLKERRDQRKQYVDLYVKMLTLPHGQTLQPEDQKQLDDLEKELSYEDIRFFRSIARMTARKDAAARRRLETEEKKNQPKTQTWGQWIWGTPASSGEDDSGDQSLTEEQQKEIDDIIDYDAWSAQDPGANAAKDLMKMRIAATLHKGSFTLRSDPHGAAKDVIALVFDSFSADVIELTESMTVKAALGGFRVYDGTTPNSLYPQIVRVKAIGGSQEPFIAQQEPLLENEDSNRDVDKDSTALEKTKSRVATDPFFLAEFEAKPLDGRADNALTVKMRHLEIIYHKQYVEAIYKFFRPPASQLESINALLDAAGQTLDGLRSQTRAGLEYALEQHKTLDLHVDMNAPIIIVPMDVTTEKSQVLVLDAGHIAVDSKPADKDAVQDVQNKRGQKYSDADYKQLEELMYDRMMLSLDSTQLLMGDDVDQCMRAIDSPSAKDQDLHIVERINMSFAVQNAIVNTPTLTRFKVAGDLPELQVNFSDRKYHTLMKFIDAAIPHFDSDEEEEKTLNPEELAILRSPVATAVKFGRQSVPEYNLDDLHDTHDTRSLKSVSSHASKSKDDEDQFYDVQDGLTEEQRNQAQQITFEFSFAVGKLKTTLFRSTSATTERPLADAALEGFGLLLKQRKHDMSVDVWLQNVRLAMCDGDKDQPPLLSSGVVQDGEAEGHKLVQVNYFQVDRDSPDFMSKYEGVDKTVDTQLSTFNITLAPEPILSLYDFIMTTFASDGEEAATVTEVGDDGESVQTVKQPPTNDKMRIKVKLTSAQVALENNGQRFAILRLPSADVGILMRGGTMRVAARLGNLSLEDLSDRSVAVPEFKQLLTIEGEELADFSYETFNPEDETFPGYNSSIHLRAGSLKFTYMQKPTHDLYMFLLKFSKLKAYYDAASEAAVQRASEVTRMMYDVVVKTPIIVLPRDGASSADSLILKLGEIVAKNKYLQDPHDTSTIEASLSGINATSEIEHNGKLNKLQLVDDVNINANVRQIGSSEHKDPHHADTEVTSDMSDVKLNLTQTQYVLVMALLQSIPEALSSFNEDEEDEDTDDSPIDSPATESVPPTPASASTAADTVLEPELALAPSEKDASVWTTLDFIFTVKTIGIEVYGANAFTEEDLAKNSIARFKLIGPHLAFKSLSNGAMEAEFALKTLAFKNTRSEANSCFRDLIPELQNEGNQIMVQYTKSSDDSALAIVTIDSPTFILAVAPLASLLEFAFAPFKGAESDTPAVEEQDDDQAVQPVDDSPGKLSYRVDIVNSTVIVLADDTNPKTQAIQLAIKEILVSQSNVLALKVDKVGMSFGRMDQPNDRVSFLDDVNVRMSLDSRRRGSRQTTTIDIDVPMPIIFRASITDMQLILDIVNKATTAAAEAMGTNQAQDGGASIKEIKNNDDAKTVATTAPSTLAPPKPVASARRGSVSRRRNSSVAPKAHILVSKEHLQLHVNGFQFVLIGEGHEMPMVHLSTKEFVCVVNDWSGDLQMGTSLTTEIRYFNLSNSYFEPLLDPWKCDLQISRTSSTPGATNPLSVKVSAAQRLELSITSSFIETGITAMTVYSKEGGDRHQKDRSPTAPFRMRNRTGMPIAVWPESDDNGPIPWEKRKVLENDADVPWFFEDRQTLRDNVSAFRHNSFGLELTDSSIKWDPIRGISVDREGEHVLNLRPKIDKVTHQLMCDIELIDNIKVITIRSTLTIDNQTSLPVEMVVVDAQGKANSGIMKIDPGECFPIPFEAVFDKRFRLRPLRGFGFDYAWSAPLFWRQLMTRPIRPISCKHMTPKEPAFYFQAQANFNAKDPSARLYPRMSLRLRAPVELENLLPYDFKFRIHDKATSLSSSNFLVKGGTSPIHTVELSHLLLLSVAPEDTPFKQSDYAIINTDDPELPIENNFTLSDPKGLKLQLKLHYYTYPDSGGAFKVQVYSPYIFLNKTGLPFDLAMKGSMGSQKPVAGSANFATDYEKDEPTPFMFSFPNDDRRDRLFLRVANSRYSQPLSFEPSSADMQIVMPSQDGKRDWFVGLSYAEGLGKYKLTKVITIAPRFIIKNLCTVGIQVRQTGEARTFGCVAPEELKPLLYLAPQANGQEVVRPQIRIAFDAPNSGLKWSAPFYINDIGKTHVRLIRQTSRGPREYLMRIETHLEGSSIFLYVSRETDPWPIIIQNDTDLPFKFKQTVSLVASLKLTVQEQPEDGIEPNACPERPIPGQSTVEYTWDWPTATEKRLLLSTGGRVLSRPIDVMAIGEQPPVKIPRLNGQPPLTITIDVSADGSSQKVVIAPYNEERNVYKLARRTPMSQSQTSISVNSSSDTIAAVGAEAEHTNDPPNLKVLVDLEGIGISVVTKRPDELMYITLRGLQVGYTDYPTYHDAFINCKWIQIDNQLFGGLFPIILYPTVVPKDGKELESHPTLQSSFAVLKDQSHGVIFVKYASILLQAMTIELDEDFVMALIDFTKFKDATWRDPVKDVLIEHPEKTISEPNVSEQQSDIFFESLQLQPVSLEISFMRTDRVNVDEKVSTRNPFYYALNALTMTLGNVNAAPINFRALFLDNVRLSSQDLQERIILHYQEQAVAQIYRVLGSADFLGNPVGLFNNISSGFADFFYEPWQGFVMHGNRDIGLGIARGATSLAMKTVFGITDSMSKFTSSIGKGLSAATLDSEYQTKRRMTQKRNKPKHALYGVAAGASAFADSVTSAFEGVASMPMEGAEKGGAAGFAKGVGKGFVGLFTKPVVGLMDFVSASTEGIRNTTTVFDSNDIDRVRLPRFIASDGVLRPYSGREALGQSWLKDLDAGAYFNETYVAHLDIPGDDAVAILSNARLLYVQLRKMRVIWQVPFDELQSLSLEQSGIALTLRGGTPGPFLPIAEQTGREWFFRKIARVVEAYNKSHQAGDT